MTRHAFESAAPLLGQRWGRGQHPAHSATGTVPTPTPPAPPPHPTPQVKDGVVVNTLQTLPLALPTTVPATFNQQQQQQLLPGAGGVVADGAEL